MAGYRLFKMRPIQGCGYLKYPQEVFSMLFVGYKIELLAALVSEIASCSGERVTSWPRQDPTFGDAEGFREIVLLEEGFQVVMGDITCHKEAYLSMKSDASLKFHYRLEGSSAIELADHHENQVTDYSMGVLLHPEGLEKHEHYLAGEHERSVTLICESEFLRQLFQSVADQLPNALADYVSKGEATAYHDSLPMKTDMVTAASKGAGTAGAFDTILHTRRG